MVLSWYFPKNMTKFVWIQLESIIGRDLNVKDAVGAGNNKVY